MGHSPFAINFARSFIKKVIINCAREWPELSIHHRKFQNVGAKGPPPSPNLVPFDGPLFCQFVEFTTKS